MDPVKTLVRDMVCNMNVDPANARASAEHDGKTYYFCSSGCASKFKADPKMYLADASAVGMANPDVDERMAGSHQQQPGMVKDPVCGMWVDPAKARGSALYKDKN